MKAKLIILLLMVGILQVYGQENYMPVESNLESREWFQDAKFGLFVHWGVYSVMAGGGDRQIAEWIMNHKKIPIDQYEKLPDFFNPIAFNPEEWVSMVKNAGMKYITITSKHHDGFAMFDSEISDYNIVKRTPYGKDVIKMLADECQKQGIKLFFYYSQLDWHHPDYYPRGRTGQGYTGRPESGNWDNYIQYMNTQLSELLTNYGDIGGIWFDGMWDQHDADWQLDETYSLIHRLQPQALIGSNHHRAPYAGEDFQMFEQDLPGENTTGWQGTDIGDLPIEMCLTINNSWGFNIIDDSNKSREEIIGLLVKAAGRNSNLLLNVGPMPNGKIQPEHVKLLGEMGEWMGTYGETIYGTRKGPVGPFDWGVTTQKEKTVYIHILDWNESSMLISDFKPKISSVVFFDDNSKVKHEVNDYGLLMHLPTEKRNPDDTIIKLTLK